MNERNTKQTILDKIARGEVRQRPRAYFLLRGVFWMAAILLTLLVAGFLASFVFFTLRVSGVGLAPGLGFRGIPILLGGTPWFILLLALLVYVVLEVLARRYAIAYRRPLTLSLLIGLLLVVGVGSAIARTEFHDAMFSRATQGGLPFAGGLYRRAERPLPDQVHTGVVVEVVEEVLTIRSSTEEILTVHIDEQTRTPRHDVIEIDDPVVVFGERDGDSIQAFGIRILDERGGPPHLRRPKAVPFDARLHRR